MQPSKRDDSQEFVTATKRNLLFALIFGIVLFLFSLFFFLRGGGSVLLGIVLALGVFCLFGYSGFLLIMLFLTRKATTVEHQVLEPKKRGRLFSRQRSSLVLKFEEKDTQIPLD